MKTFSKSILHKFSTSTALGLTLGVFLAAYAVFAFDPPASAPPGGNVIAPLNVGPDAQIKEGGLWVGSLGVDGGAQFGGVVESTSGGFKFPDGTVQSTKVSLYPTFNAGSALWHSNDSYYSVGRVSRATLAKRSEIAAYGTLRISYRSDVNNMRDFTVHCLSYIARNGSRVGPRHSNERRYFNRGSDRYATYTDNISGWSPGDKVEVYTWTNDDDDDGDPAAGCAVDNFRIYVDILIFQTKAIQ